MAVNNIVTAQRNQMFRCVVSTILRLFSKTFVFCYHRVLPFQKAQEQLVHRALYVTPRTFEKHVKWLKQNGSVVGLNQLFADTKRPKFMITFDDGWKDNLTYAMPILRKYDVTASIFIATKNVDQGRLFWSENLGIQVSNSLKSKTQEYVNSILEKQVIQVLSEFNIEAEVTFRRKSSDLYYLLDRLTECLKLISCSLRDDVLCSLYGILGVPSQDDSHKYLLNWNEVSSLAREGVSFGSHTHTHALLDRADNKTIDQELSKSKKILQEKLGKEINTFSYPNGYFQNPYIQFSLLRNGYKYAFTLERLPVRTVNPFFIPRCLVFEDIAYSMERYYVKLLIKSFLNQPHKYFEQTVKRLKDFFPRVI